ncbi:MAG: FAD-binding oxidoreductase [Beijerinckiaceae bacterium]|jgi:FAD/FMN-containing dehydrogenase
MPPHEEFLAQLRAIAGPAYVLTDRRDMAGYLSEPRDLYRDGQAICVVRPGSREEVSAILALCQSTRTAVVPQGGNTGLVGGQTPLSDGASIVLSLTRMNALRELDLVSNTMTVEAGMTLLQAQEAASQAGRLFPLSLAAEGSCTIGGNLATNAGGTAVIAFGTARDLVNGLEVVLADGRVLSNLSKLRKDNTGYDLKHLFMGSEGTLGIITAAVLKLYPKPRAVETAFVALASPEAALSLLTRAKEHFGNAIRAFELLPRIALEIVLRHRGSQRDPFGQPHAWYVLLEVTSQAEEGLDELLFAFLEAATEEGLIEDATVATSLDQAKKLWDIRESLPDLSKLEGGSIKHDISVPVGSVAAFIAETTPAVLAAIPGARPVPFGHVGDGNIHYNVSQPIGADKAAFLARWDELNTLVHGIAAKYEGSISAEHGIGQLKRHLLAEVKDPVALDTMRAIKAALDPLGILNPGKVL